MADNSTVARPYAKAVFELANEQGKLEQWSTLLEALSTVASDPGVQTLLHNPKVGDDKIAQLIIDAVADRLDKNGQNFVRLLAENDRVAFLPEIAVSYEELRAEAERTIDVNVTSAAPLSEQHKAEMTTSLQRRLGRDVRLHCEVDESLIGGAVIRAGDLVIDSSLRGRLAQLATNLNN